MRFAEPIFALALIAIPLLVWLALRAARLRVKALHRLAGSRARPPVWRAWPVLLRSAGVAALIVAAMRPQWGVGDEPVARGGRDILVMLDVSLSMFAKDGDASGGGGDRLERARAGVLGLVEKLKSEGGHRLGLVTFAGRATLLSPLSSDYDLAAARLALADPRKAPGAGTRLNEALEKTLQGFVGDAPEYTDIVVLSDGEDFGDDFDAAAKTAAAAGVRMHAFGIGNPLRAVVLSVPGNDGRRVTIEYQGQPVRTRMQAQTLRALVSAGVGEDGVGGGEYVQADTGRVALADWYHRSVASAPRRILGGTAEAQPLERYPWFVFIALLLFGLDAALSLPRRRLWSVLGIPWGRAAVVVSSSAVVVGFSFLEPVTQALIDGGAAFRDGRFVVAREHYERALGLEPQSAPARFGLGASRYRTDDLEGALEAFKRVQAGERETLAARAHYNEGVVHYQRAIERLQSPEEAAVAIRSAIHAFRATLALAPALADARYNLTLALRLMGEIESRQRSQSMGERGGNDSGGQRQSEEAGFNPGDERESQPQSGAGSGEGGLDPSGLAGKPASGSGGQGAMSGSGQRGQRAQSLTHDDAEQLLTRVRLNVQAAIDDAGQHRLNRMKAGATGPFW